MGETRVSKGDWETRGREGRVARKHLPEKDRLCSLHASKVTEEDWGLNSKDSPG